MRSRVSASSAALSMIILGSLLAAACSWSASAQTPEIPALVNITLSRTTVYRGYQVVEITAYFYRPPGTSISSISGTAVLISGIQVSLPMAYVVPASPVTITVGNVSYSIRDILIVRLPIPSAALTGRATINVSYVISAVVGGNRTTIPGSASLSITILDQSPVERARLDALVQLWGARNILSIAEVLIGSPLEDQRAALNSLERVLSDADTSLFVEGDVDSALAKYSQVIAGARETASQILARVQLLQVQRSQAIEANLSAQAARISAIEESLRRAAASIGNLSSGLAALATAFANYSTTVNNYLSTLDRNIVDTNRKIDALASDVNRALNETSTRISQGMGSLGSSLSTIQTTLAVIAIALLVSVVILGLRSR